MGREDLDERAKKNLRAEKDPLAFVQLGKEAIRARGETEEKVGQGESESCLVQ